MPRGLRLLAAALLLLVVGCSAGAPPQLVDQLFERYVRPKAVAAPAALHLLYLRKTDVEEQLYTCHRRFVPGKGWSKEETLRGGYLCVGCLDGALYLFRTSNYSVYRGSDWWTLGWPLRWAPSAACPVGEELWVFGAETAGGGCRLRAARIGLGAAGPPGGAPPSAFAEPLKVVASPYDLSAIARARSAMVFWHQDVSSEPPDEQANELWRASFDGERWTTPQRVALPYRSSDYAVAEHAGRAWVFCKQRGRRLSTVRPLQVITLTEPAKEPPPAPGTLGAALQKRLEAEMARQLPGIALTDVRASRPTAVPEAVDPLLDWTFDIDAAPFGGTLFVFRACMNRIIVQQWRDERWLQPETLFATSPWATYAVWWSLANVLASLVLLPAVAGCALRARGKVRHLVLLSGMPVTTATWTRRVAAILVDLLVIHLLGAAATVVLSVGEGGAVAVGSLPAMVGLHVTIFFVYFVISESVSGQSLGKRMLNIAVVGADGRRPSLGRVVIRNLLRPWLPLLPVAYLIGSVIVLLSPKSQRLGDRLAGTYVIDGPPPPPARAAGE